MTDDYGVAHIGKCGAVCDDVTNNDAVIQKELAAGAKELFLPAHTLWVPERNYVPGNIRVIGEDWLTVIIKAANPENEYIVVGPYTECINVSFFDQVEPGLLGFNVKSPRPIRLYQNLRSGDAIPTHYARTGWMATVGASGQDQCALTINGHGVGDLAFIGADDDSTGLHFYVNGEDVARYSTGILMDIFGRGPGLHLVGRDTCKQTYALARIEQQGEGPSLMFTPGAKADEVVVFMLGHDSTGQCLHVYHHEGTNSGTPVYLDMGRGGGTYTGKPIRYRNGAVEPFVVDNAGNIESEQMTSLELRIAELEAKLAIGTGVNASKTAKNT